MEGKGLEKIGNMGRPEEWSGHVNSRRKYEVVNLRNKKDVVEGISKVCMACQKSPSHFFKKGVFCEFKKIFFSIQKKI